MVWSAQEFRGSCTRDRSSWLHKTHVGVTIRVKLPIASKGFKFASITKHFISRVRFFFAKIFIYFAHFFFLQNCLEQRRGEQNECAVLLKKSNVQAAHMYSFYSAYTLCLLFCSKDTLVNCCSASKKQDFGL